MTRNEKLERYNHHRDEAERILRSRSLEHAQEANAHATLALLYLTDLLASDA